MTVGRRPSAVNDDDDDNRNRHGKNNDSNDSNSDNDNSNDNSNGNNNSNSNNNDNNNNNDNDDDNNSNNITTKATTSITPTAPTTNNANNPIMKASLRNMTLLASRFSAAALQNSVTRRGPEAASARAGSAGIDAAEAGQLASYQGLAVQLLDVAGEVAIINDDPAMKAKVKGLRDWLNKMFEIRASHLANFAGPSPSLNAPVAFGALQSDFDALMHERTHDMQWAFMRSLGPAAADAIDSTESKWLLAPFSPKDEQIIVDRLEADAAARKEFMSPHKISSVEDYIRRLGTSDCIVHDGETLRPQFFPYGVDMAFVTNAESLFESQAADVEAVRHGIAQLAQAPLPSESHGVFRMADQHATILTIAARKACIQISAAKLLLAVLHPQNLQHRFIEDAVKVSYEACFNNRNNNTHNNINNNNHNNNNHNNNNHNNNNIVTQQQEHQQQQQQRQQQQERQQQEQQRQQQQKR